ncbi:spore germination protein KB [Paenibacillus albidus]|uniref:Spore germination protein KB n=1 Tax=Paenibacillus albidus TaxID=2041023 RepID=A0A917C251_9BACL|nr:GerAB/ArcD/ProY family transporter [Paenibacillus albidus]GGF65141.1 spore germination protein KB [Paenibacillus albidus]
MRKEVIGTNQLFAMIILFELGTAIVVPIGLESGHAVWLSILLALPGGVLLYLVYHDLSRQYPGLIISGYTRKILGRTIGWPLSLLYIPVFMFNGSRNLREAGDLLIAASYDRTPVFIINAIMVIAVMYILNKGLEVFARTAEIYLAVIFVLGFICSFVVIAAGLVDFKNLFPLHAADWRQAFRSAYPNIWIFPFGELVCITTVLPHLKESRLSGKTGVGAIVLSGILLCVTHAIEMSVLGEDVYHRATFPMYTTITLVNLANFIQRLDALVILTLIIGVFFKMTLYCYAAIAVTADLFKVQDTRKLAVPVGVVVLFSSFISAENYPRHMEEGGVFLRYILPVLCAVIPILLFIVHRIRKRFGLLR